MPRLIRALAAAAVVAAVPPAVAQSQPVNGMRHADLRSHAIVGATVHVAPGRVIDQATIVIRDGVVEAVGANAIVPGDARVWDAEGLTIYPGLIESAVLVDHGERPASDGAHWNSMVHPEVALAERSVPDASLRKELRKLGFTAAAVYPERGIFRGTGVVVALGDETDHVLAYRDHAAMGLAFERGGWGGGGPNSLMGSLALVRQTLHDAKWHAECRRVYANHPEGNEPPVRADALLALNDVINGDQRVLVDVSDEHNALRAARIAAEFELDMVLLGSGYEFRRLPEIVATGLPVITPLQFPKRPELDTLSSAQRVSLRDMMTWEQAPTNARRLIDAGVPVAFTTHRLKKRGDLHESIRTAIEAGLTETQALAALTTTPAELLGLDDVLGTIEPGKAGNLVVVDGSLFDEEMKVRDVWVNGRRHEINGVPTVELVASGTLETDLGISRPLEVDTGKKSVTVLMPADEGDDAEGEPEAKKHKARKVVVQQDQIAFVLEGEPFEADGFVRLSGVLTDGVITGSGLLPDGDRFTFTFTPDPDAGADDEQVAAAPGALSQEDPDDEDEGASLPPEELVFPLGAYGLATPPQAETVLVTNATIWTCGEDGILENHDMLVVDGKIEKIGRGLSAPRGATVIDATDKHVTPGLIDCHSHTGIHGGVNEGSQTNTAEVRIGDCVNPDDINWYRQLAGGLTAANQLHGSANPIGGQNSVVKLKWGGSASDFSVAEAPGGIKFALGENVKRSENRYPNTRMGVETFIRDAFTAAVDYQAAWDRYLGLPTEQQQRTMPPRRDLELDTLVEIIEGERLVHCHSYRQDEILMLIRVADQFGFTIGTFQHVLEGYKVADAIAEHGAGGSSFSDWWAYKMEVIDAIPYNGALMTEVGVVVSFNSDSSELARRMNTEAAKAVRYGGMDPHEALKVVSLNPAKQLKIDHRTGSLETGKDADFVVWSANPLSTYARCEQTWIEGARYFSVERDRALRKVAAAERQRLEQTILAAAHGGGGKMARGDDDDGEGGDRPSVRRRGRPTRLMERLLLARERWMEEQVRLGHDPEQIVPGRCACNDVWFMMEAGK